MRSVNVSSCSGSTVGQPITEQPLLLGGIGETTPPAAMERQDDRVGGAFQQDHQPQEKGSPEPRNDYRDDGRNDEASEYVREVMGTHDHASDRDEGRDDEEEPPDALVNHVDAEGDPESGAGMVARERRVV